jgi:hypothetical protein
VGTIHSNPRAASGLSTGSPAEIIRGTKSSGPRGIESILEYRGVYLNIREWIDTYLVNNIDGLDDADVRDNREPNPGYHGELPLPSFYGGRTIVLQGKIVAHTIWKLRDMEQGLRQAFSDISREYPLIFRSSDIATDLMINCKKSSQIRITDTQKSSYNFERDFQITLRAGDPRFISYQQQYASNGLAQLSLLNQGNFDAGLRLKLAGPLINPIMSLTRSDSVIQTFKVNGTIPAGETWQIDSDKHLFTDQAGIARWSMFDNTSDWLELGSGPEHNTLTIDASGATGASAIAAFWNNTYM